MLNKNKPYAEVYGKGPERFEQDNKFFLADGSPVVSGEPVETVVQEDPVEEVDVSIESSEEKNTEPETVYQVMTLRDRFLVTDKKDKNYIGRPEMLAMLNAVKTQHNLHLKYNIRMNRSELLSILMEAIDGLES